MIGLGTPESQIQKGADHQLCLELRLLWFFLRISSETDWDEGTGRQITPIDPKEIILRSTTEFRAICD
jgi:hypothetical protein